MTREKKEPRPSVSVGLPLCSTILKCDPTSARCGSFCLLRFRPGPVHSALDDLVVSGSPNPTISTSCLARTQDQHGRTEDRTPNLKSFNGSSLQEAGLQEHATIPGERFHSLFPIKTLGLPQMAFPTELIYFLDFIVLNKLYCKTLSAAFCLQRKNLLFILLCAFIRAACVIYGCNGI